VAEDTGADWGGYYASSSGREPRPLLLATCQRLGAGAGRTAVDLGCGDGTDALALLDRGAGKRTGSASRGMSRNAATCTPVSRA
jgi:hypothetical protein